MTRVLVTGGTGFIGRHLVNELSARGDSVTVLSRGALPSTGPVRYVRWDPSALGAWCDALSGSDAIVHLAGERVVGVRYSEAVKQRILESRIASTERLVTAIERAAPRPRVLVSCSAVGYYGCRHDAERLDENSPPGTDFLAQVCVAWERAAHAAEALGVRVVCVRMGIALGRGGGALDQMSEPFRWFVGGPIAGGTQGVSWIHIDDAVRALLACCDDPRFSGAVNATSPNPASNAELSHAIGHALRRPSFVPVPGWALKLVFGAGAEPILSGQWVLPKRLLEAGFVFRYPALAGAVAQALAGDAA